MNIKKLLKNKPFCNELHFFLFAVILLFLSINYPIFIIFLIIYFIFIFKKTKLFIPIFTTSLIFFTSFSFQRLNRYELSNIKYEGEFLVEEVQENYIIIKEEIKVIIFTKNTELKPGDIIHAELDLYPLEESSYDGDFDSKAYYESKRIYNRAIIKNFELIDHKLTISYLRYKALNYYEKLLKPKTFNYLKAIIFGESDLETEVDDAYKTLYISHILTISGMHIMFLYEILKWIFNKIFKIEGDVLSTSIIFLYIIFLDFNISALRAFLFLFIGLINKVGYIKYTKLDILSIAFTLMVLINPFLMNQTGFILTYLVSFILIFMNDITKHLSNYKKVIMNTLICILITLPIIINLNNNIAIIGLIYAIIISLFLPKLLLTLMLIILIIPSGIYEYIFVGLDYLLILFSNHSLTIKFPYISIYLAIFYYILFILLLISLIKNKNIFRSFLLIIFYLICLKSIVLINPNYQVTFIDVGQGDSALIQAPHNKCNILIDSYNNLDYLNSLGIDSIDYIFLSHLDNDHTGSIAEVLSNFDVKKVFYSYYSDTSKIDNINSKWVKIKADDSLNLDGINISVLSPLKSYGSENENSLVLKFSIGNYKFLFTGDIDSQVENDLINTYGNKLKSDVLKVAHHGSNTSSNLEFINFVNPSYSIISVAQNNYYGLPDEEIIDRIRKNSNSSLYMTKDNGNIKFIIRKNSLFCNTYK